MFNTSNGDVLATVKLGGVSSAPCAMMIAADTCFVAGPTSVSAFALPTLKLVWTSKLKNSGLLSSIAKISDSIIVGQDKQVSCLSAASGDVRWSAQLNVNNNSKDIMHGLQVVPFDGEQFLAAGKTLVLFLHGWFKSPLQDMITSLLRKPQTDPSFGKG